MKKKTLKLTTETLRHLNNVEESKMIGGVGSLLALTATADSWDICVPGGRTYDCGDTRRASEGVQCGGSGISACSGCV